MQREKIYTPVIVTNSDLIACLAKIDKVSLSDGSVGDLSEFRTVPYIRFTKPLTAELLSATGPLNHEQIRKNKERTVFVVNAQALGEFLSKFDVIKGEEWPWERLQREEYIKRAGR